MNISINNHAHEAKKGDRLLDIARSNHEHIGYFCGGNSICQTCYVKVLEGSENLSPLSVEEKALLSDRLINEGTRMACLTTIEKEGEIRVVSLVEEVKRSFETNPLQLTEHAAKMGWESLVKFPDTMRMQGGREFDLWQLIADVISGIGDALQLLANAFVPASSVDGKTNPEACKPFQLSAFCNGNKEKNTQRESEGIAA
ncbi:MAG: 2Fe-2S iron-sulfur cluster-binding protein [Chlorobium sp.]|nr:MAG: (2Fe-2S)-binding protein [Chlorobium sp.]